MVGGSVVTWGFKREGGDSSAVAARLTEGVVQVCGNIGALRQKPNDSRDKKRRLGATSKKRFEV